MKVHRPRCARPLYAQSSEYASSIVDFGAYVRSFRDVLLPGCFTPNISIRFLLRFVISRIFHSSMHPTAYVLSNDCDLSSTDDYDFCRARSSSKIFTSCQTRDKSLFQNTSKILTLQTSPIINKLYVLSNSGYKSIFESSFFAHPTFLSAALRIHSAALSRSC